MKILLGVLFFLALGAFFIISNYNLALYEDSNTALFKVYYGQWVDSLIDQVGGITGYVVNSDWLPSQNSSQG